MIINHFFGFWYLKNQDYPDGKFINYHAGPAPEVSLGEEIPVLDNSSCDPIFVIQDYMSKKDLLDISLQLELLDNIKSYFEIFLIKIMKVSDIYHHLQMTIQF